MSRYGWKDFFREATDFVFAGILFLIFTVLGAFFTLGAAFKALFFVAFRILDHRKAVSVFTDFWKAFKEGFWTSTLVWLVAAGMGAACYFVIRFALDSGFPWIAATGVTTGVLLLIFLLYYYPMTAVFQTKSVWQMGKNAWIMAARHPLSTLFLVGGLAVPVLLFGWWYGTILVSMAAFAAIEGWHLQKLFRPYLAEFEPVESTDQLEK